MRYVGLGSLFLLSGCAIWPYQSDFDCPVPSGEHCKSLYEVNKQADTGRYHPDVYQPSTPSCGSCE